MNEYKSHFDKWTEITKPLIIATGIRAGGRPSLGSLSPLSFVFFLLIGHFAGMAIVVN